jgi:hypothetical protein
MLAVRPSGYTWNFFATSEDPVVQQLQKNLIPFVENSEGGLPPALHYAGSISQLTDPAHECCNALLLSSLLM